MPAMTPDRAASPTPSQLPPVPASPTYSYASTANPLSTYNLPLPPPPRPVHAVLSKADLDASQAAYADLLTTAKSYRVALAALSTASSAFGSALEACARLKEARAEPLGPTPQGASLSNSFHAAAAGSSCTADPLMSASGVHHLVANHHHILSETVYRSFEVPLLHELDKWRQAVDDEEESYARSVRDKSREISRLEKEGLKLHRQRRRDVGRFRAHLVDLTNKLDGLTSLHGDHARTLLRESQETSGKIVDASCSLVRAEVDIFESLARKGWTGGGLDDLLERGTDLFASEPADGDLGHGGASPDAAKLFSILPPRSILADAAHGHARSDSLLVDDADRYQSLIGAAVAADVPQDESPTTDKDTTAPDTASVFSSTTVSRRRPFSPQPIRRDPTDVTYDDNLGLRLSESDEEDGGGFGGRRDGGGIVERLEAAVEEGDDEEDQPWRHEGLRRKDTNTTTSTERGRRRWSVNEDEPSE
ncbi:hypothetical protein F5X68DRAFT_267996 [Plectosphaerella plurivora]|uniref:Phospholipid-binding protein n=1 Tax=Plectosphaerella plurivora TaxID=936078 RepID=A0A9P8VG94_9PEZI|nr:hypothetical protein F5X68DRAFT_267996 [Plectosphaerella plurivora]